MTGDLGHFNGFPGISWFTPAPLDISNPVKCWHSGLTMPAVWFDYAGIFVLTDLNKASGCRFMQSRQPIHGHNLPLY